MNSHTFFSKSYTMFDFRRTLGAAASKSSSNLPKAYDNLNISSSVVSFYPQSWTQIIKDIFQTWTAIQHPLSELKA